MSSTAVGEEVGGRGGALRSVDTDGGRRLRSLLRWVLVAVLGVGVLGAAVLIHPAAKGTLDPQNPKRAGAQAAAQVLRDHGVTIDVPRSIGAFADSTVDGSTTVVIVNSNQLSPGNARRAIDHTRFAHRTVLVAPGSATLEAMDVPASATVYWSSTPVKAACSTDVVRSEVAVQRGVRAYRPAAGSSWTSCFTELAPTGAAPLLTRTDAAGRELVLLGYDDFLSNERVAADDNAGLAIRALGVLTTHWSGTSPATATSPTGRRPARRPAVPVVVPTARLAARHGHRPARRGSRPPPRSRRPGAAPGRHPRDRDDGEPRTPVPTRRRPGPCGGPPARRHHRTPRPPVRHPAGAAPDALVDAVSRATGRVPRDLHSLLFTPIGRDDRALLDLAQQLSDLEEQVRTS